ncbi:MAG TPA: SGNH/GDSL hydrolase family protein [Stellaceae bacterium]|nr:SGNH/GDSL hydrolase family protein [Stellaceae bacterium]
MAGDTHWVGTWATSPVVTEGLAFDNQTLRIIARVSIGGTRVRVRVSNACGLGKLTIGGARIGLRERDARIVPGSDRALTFGGLPSVTIPVGALAVSDPVALDLPDLADVAVSLHVPGKIAESLPITGHGNARQSNYVSPPGDHTKAADMPVAQVTENWYFLTGIDVLAPREVGCIVAFGDSLTDGNLSTPDTNARWPDQLARRIVARGAGRRMSVVNHGIGGNRILHDMRGDSGLRRFDRDVLAQVGASHVIVFLGTNDLRNRNAKPEEEVTAADMIAGLQQIAARGQAAGLKIYGCTLLPYENETFLPGAWTPKRDAYRNEVNAWIRDRGAFDTVIDFDKTLRDPAHPARMLPPYDCGDHLHPGDLGYKTLGDSIPLSLFD